MTTVLADVKQGAMVCDSAIIGGHDGDRVWSGSKVKRIRGALIGFAGHVPDLEGFIAWYRGGMAARIRFRNDRSEVLLLCAAGLFLFDDNATELQRVTSGREAIGTGGKVAIGAYEALGHQDMRRAVRIACKHDSNSRAPVRSYSLRTA